MSGESGKSGKSEGIRGAHPHQVILDETGETKESVEPVELPDSYCSEAMDAVHWVSDLPFHRPYASKYFLISEEMLDAAIHPEQILLVKAAELRRTVDSFVTDQAITPRGAGMLCLSWVRPVAQSPSVAVTPPPEAGE